MRRFQTQGRRALFLLLLCLFLSCCLLATPSVTSSLPLSEFLAPCRCPISGLPLHVTSLFVAICLISSSVCEVARLRVASEYRTGINLDICEFIVATRDESEEGEPPRLSNRETSRSLYHTSCTNRRKGYGWYTFSHCQPCTPMARGHLLPHVVNGTCPAVSSLPSLPFPR